MGMRLTVCQDASMCFVHMHTHTHRRRWFFLEIKQVDKTLQSQLFTTWASKCDQYMTITNININEAKITCTH